MALDKRESNRQELAKQKDGAQHKVRKREIEDHEADDMIRQLMQDPLFNLLKQVK